MWFSNRRAKWRREEKARTQKRPLGLDGSQIVQHHNGIPTPSSSVSSAGSAGSTASASSSNGSNNHGCGVMSPQHSALLNSQQLNQSISSSTPLIGGDTKAALAAAAVATSNSINGINGNLTNSSSNGSTGVSPVATPTARYPQQAMPPTSFMQPSHMYTNLQHMDYG